MSFVAAFYSFTVELNHVDGGIFTRFRLKTALHPHESLEHLYARVLAYAHAYRPEQAFSQGLFEPRDPTIWEKDVLGEVQAWVYVGVPETKVLETALRTWPSASFRIYFYQQDQVDRICYLMNGSRSPWLSRVTFYRLDAELLQALVPLHDSSPSWNVTFVDDEVYLSVQGHEFQSSLPALDMAREFQQWLTMQNAV